MSPPGSQRPHKHRDPTFCGKGQDKQDFKKHGLSEWGLLGYDPAQYSLPMPWAFLKSPESRGLPSTRLKGFEVVRFVGSVCLRCARDSEGPVLVPLWN